MTEGTPADGHCSVFCLVFFSTSMEILLPSDVIVFAILSFIKGFYLKRCRSADSLLYYSNFCSVFYCSMKTLKCKEYNQKIPMVLSLLLPFEIEIDISRTEKEYIRLQRIFSELKEDIRCRTK